MKKVLFSVMAILLAVGVVGGGAFAIFQDVETVEVGDIAAGTLDLTVDDVNPCIQHITIGPIAPGYSVEYLWVLKNTGSIPGKVTVEFSAITNDDNNCNQPECLAEGGTWDGTSCTGDCGDDQGELGQYLKAVGKNSDKNVATYANYPFTPNYHMTGPGGGLNRLGGHTYNLDYWDGVLGEDEYVTIKMTFSLDDDLVDCNLYYGVDDIDDNIIQSDSVEFNIIFHLDQVTP